MTEDSRRVRGSPVVEGVRVEPSKRRTLAKLKWVLLVSYRRIDGAPTRSNSVDAIGCVS